MSVKTQGNAQPVLLPCVISWRVFRVSRPIARSNVNSTLSRRHLNDDDDDEDVVDVPVV